MKNQFKSIFWLLRPVLTIFLYGILFSANASTISISDSPYDGSDIVVTAIEINGSIEFTIKNLGNDMDAPRGYEIIEDDILLKSGNYNLNASNGNETVITIQASPGYYTIYADQHLEHPKESQAMIGIEILSSNIAAPTVKYQSNPKINFDVAESSSVGNFALETKIYPNPCLDFLIIEVSSIKSDLSDCTIMIYNAQGLLIEKINGLKETQQINTSNFLSGYYFLSIRDANYNSTKTKFIKAGN